MFHPPLLICFVSLSLVDESFPVDSILSLDARDGGDMKAFVDGRAAEASAAVEHMHLHLMVCK